MWLRLRWLRLRSGLGLLLELELLLELLLELRLRLRLSLDFPPSRPLRSLLLRPVRVGLRVRVRLRLSESLGFDPEWLVLLRSSLPPPPPLCRGEAGLDQFLPAEVLPPPPLLCREWAGEFSQGKGR